MFASRTVVAVRACGAGARAAAAAPGARGAPARAASVDASPLRGAHLDNMFDLTPRDLRALLDISHGLKAKLSKDPASYRPLVRRRGGAPERVTRRVGGNWGKGSGRAPLARPPLPRGPLSPH
jgi:hypothetical protein